LTSKKISVDNLSLTPPSSHALTNSEEFHKGKINVPETRGVEEGSTKRNIQRKNSHDPKAHAKKQGGGGGGKGKWHPANDGSMD
jgi:hypothetical protein